MSSGSNPAQTSGLSYVAVMNSYGRHPITVDTCSGPDAAESLSYAAFGDNGTREFFTHVRFHKHEGDQIVVHMLVELYARSQDEATDVLEQAARGDLAITSLAEESRPPAAGVGGADAH